MATSNTSCAFEASLATISVTDGSPLVKVPVLSNAMMEILPAVSTASAFLNNMPISAPFPVATRMTVGTAIPNAHGHAITRTVIAAVMEKLRDASRAKNQRKNASSEMRNTNGTKYEITLSATLWIGALDDCASLTNLMIWDRALCSPIPMASICRIPFLLIVPPMTFIPGVLSTGMDSPVIRDSSTDESPSTTLPSTGILSPGLTSTLSPTTTSEIANSTF